jgi:hypothetical protein
METKNATRLGEVTEASTNQYTAQCYELYRSPPFGSLVSTKNGEIQIYGLVHNVATSGIEPGRRPLARGKDENTEDGIFESNPQLLKLLKSEFGVIIIGYRQNGNVYHYLPPNPPRIHGFVYQCSSEEVLVYSRSFNFLNMLFCTTLETPAEELAAAALRLMSREQAEPRKFLVGAGKALSVLLGRDFNRLKAILDRIKQ